MGAVDMGTGTCRMITRIWRRIWSRSVPRGRSGFLKGCLRKLWKDSVKRGWCGISSRGTRLQQIRFSLYSAQISSNWIMRSWRLNGLGSIFRWLSRICLRMSRGITQCCSRSFSQENRIKCFSNGIRLNLIRIPFSLYLSITLKARWPITLP